MTIIKVFILGSLILMVAPSRANSDAAQRAFQARDYLQATSLFESNWSKMKMMLQLTFLAIIAV
jgi:hypothetical protein